jgi:osmotically-inducible protein OsmY
MLLTTSPVLAAGSATPAGRKQTAEHDAKQQPFSDRDILVAIENEFEFDPAVDGRLVNVAVQDGIVTLTGKVDNLLSRDRAARLRERSGVSAASVIRSPSIRSHVRIKKSKTTSTG